MNEFNKGDIIRGASSKYVYTNGDMTKAEVLDIDTLRNRMTIRMLEHTSCEHIGMKFEVENNAKLFELVCPANIVIYRKGKEVIAWDQSSHEEAVARCCPDDEFDFAVGAKLALDRLLEKQAPIKVGDIVKVIDDGKLYTTYTKWVENHIHGDNKYMWDRGKYADITSSFRVIVIAKNALQSDIMLAYIKDLTTERCYLIGIDGLEKQWA